MFSKSSSSLLVAFFMISVVFTGCLDDAEEVEETLPDEVKCLLIVGEYEILDLEITPAAGMSSGDENVVKGHIKFSDSEYDADTEKCNISYNIVDADSNLHVNSDNSAYEYMAEISGNSSNMVIIDTDGSIILGDDIEEYSGSLENSGNITLSGIAVLVPCDGCFDDAKKGELVVGIDGNAPGEGLGCIDYEDENGNGLYDSGEPCNDGNSPISYTVTVDSLEAVFNKMYQEDDGGYYYTEDKWVIHDISEIVEIDGMLMFGVTGKEQADGYDCGLETWYIFPGQSTFTPGQCLLFEKPTWHAEYVPSNDGALWAPNFHGSHTMYYTLPMSNEGSHSDTQSCIGMVTATGTAPNLVWTDHGEPILCQAEGEDNNEDPEPPALDPAIFTDDDGRMYVVYGGAHIWITELDPATGKHIDGSAWDNGDSGVYTHLANGASDDPLYTEDGQDPWAEAPYIHKEGDYYYLFVNWYSCCQGPASTYEIVVGRSSSVTGPYLDDTGTDMKDFGGKLVIAQESHNVIGPGHAGIFEYESDNGIIQVFTHHYYPGDETPWAYAQARTLSWDGDGWPVVSQDEWNPMDYWGISDDSGGSCSADTECGEGQVCQEGQCVDSDDSDGSCSVNTECGEGQVCQEGQCVDSEDEEDNQKFLLFVGDSDIENWADYAPEDLDEESYENLGVGGATCEEIADDQYGLVADLQQYQPIWVILVCGENDLGGDATVEETFGYFEEVVEIIHNSGANVLYMGTKPEPATADLHDMYQDYDASIKEYAQWLRENNEGNLIVVDVYASFEDLGNPDSLYDDDELHLSSEGYGYWNQWASSGIDDPDACVIWQSNSCVDSDESNQNHDISITENMDFDPEELTITVGDTVTWTNNDGMSHTATSTSGPESFDSGNMGSGDTWSFTFTEAGTYEYKCDYHSSMTATIIVNA